MFKVDAVVLKTMRIFSRCAVGSGKYGSRHNGHT